MKFGILTTVCLTLLASKVTSAQGGLCYQYSKTKGKCIFCYLSKPQGTGCGQVLPTTDNCLIYGGYFGSEDCFICKEGSYSQFSNGKVACFNDPTPIPGCADEIKISNQRRCTICKDGYPDRTLHTCTSSSNVKNPVKNCLYGTTNSLGKLKCYKCKKGFASHSSSGQCTADTSGCLYYDETTTPVKCGSCDVYDGYTMKADGTCYKA